MKDLGGYSKKGHQWNGNSIKDQELWEESTTGHIVKDITCG